MYDPARDIFTETQPSSSSSPPPVESYDHLSALDTLAGLAAEAEFAFLPDKKQPRGQGEQPIKDKVKKESVVQQQPPAVKENGVVQPVPHKQAEDKETKMIAENFDEPIPHGGVEVARTNEPERSLKVTLHIRKDRNKLKQEEMSQHNEQQPEQPHSAQRVQERPPPVDSKAHSPASPMKQIESPTQPITKQASPKPAPSKESSPKKDDSTAPEDARTEKGDHSYPIPLSLSRLAKIPKRKTEDRREKPDREQNRSRDSDRDRRPPRRPSRSPPLPYSSRSPSYDSRTPLPRRLSDDRYRPTPHPLIDSYRPSRDRDDHYSPPKRPRSPSPPRQLKRPVRRDVTTADRERERRERQLRDVERQKADLEAARSRPVYETVRQHYNEREDRGREARQESRIFKLRKFNNWIKSVLIAKFIPERTEEEIDEDRGLFVLDIGCGKGGDLGKWQKQRDVQGYVGVDIAEMSIMHAEQRAAELRGRRFSTRFFAMDCFVDPIRARLSPHHPLFDIVSMQFVMHYSFESEDKARTMLMNVSKNLRRGGYFIGTIPSSDAIIEGIKSLPEDSKEFGNSVYKIRFPERPTETVFRPPYGHRYNFYMEDAVENVPEYIVPFEVFRGLAEDANLEMVYRRSFHEIYQDEKDDEEFGRLMDRMGVKDEDGVRGIKGEEWDAAGLYLAFAFEKRGGY